MGEAGYTRDAQSFFADKQGARFFLDFAVMSASDIERMQAILSDGWKQAGFEVRPRVFDPRAFASSETRSTVPGLAYSFHSGERGFTSAEVSSPANRWSTTNRGGWTNPEYDRLYDVWSSTLDPVQRGILAAQMVALVSQNVPGYTLYASTTLSAWVAALHGPTDATNSAGFGQTAKLTTYRWNVYDWTMS
jgi:ABC-type transport system substrate-binding protein